MRSPGFLRETLSVHSRLRFMARKGSILIETLIALLVLSVGIVSLSGIFWNSLFFTSRIARESAGLNDLRHRVFLELANSQGIPAFTTGALTVPIAVDDAGADLSCRINTQKLNTAGGVSSQADFFQIDYSVVGRQEKEVVALNAVVY